MIRILILAILVSACAQSSEKALQNGEDQAIDDKDSLAIQQARIDSITELRFSKIGLVNVQKLDPRIQVDLRYASANNFMRHQLYDTLRHLFLQKDVAVRLSSVQDLLDSLRPGFRLLLYDGVRPRQVQAEMWKALDSIPIIRRGQFVSNPALGSIHNFGAAVDLTIVDEKGKELDMGADYDDFRKIAFPSLEAHYLATGELTAIHLANRQLLRHIMRSEGFSNIPSEWWHFNATSRIGASHKYQLLITESGEARWFKIVETNSSQSDSLMNPE